MRLRSPLVKVATSLAALGVVGYLFALTLSDVASEPYTVRANRLQGWIVEPGQTVGPEEPILVLRPPEPMGLFDQVFLRAMESFTSPVAPGIALVLRGELAGATADTISEEDLLEIARTVGLPPPLEPRCMVVHRTTGGREQRFFFVLFEMPQFDQFRVALGDLVSERGGDRSTFDPDALSPVLLVASTERATLRQQPSRRQLEEDCEAPVMVVEGGGSSER